MVALTSGPGTVLTVNTGSSSLKCALFVRSGAEPRRVATLTIPRLDLGELTVLREGAAEQRHHVEGAPLSAVLDALPRLGLPAPDAVGHRFVHGGPDLTGPALLDDATVARLRDLVAWAPLHQPAALLGVDLVRARLPDVRQVGSFDTAFHRSMPHVAQRLPLPEWTWKAGLRRYGFHGLSYEHIVATLGADRLGRAVVAHLGNGSSLVAIADGRSVDTTMGFSPDGGVVMGSRSGDLDPGVLLHLLDDGLSVADLRAVVHEHGGLRGLSGGTADMQTLLARRENGDERAALAVEMYCRRIRMQIGAYIALLGGLDTLVFTGGIGEHADAVRSEICRGLDVLGIRLDGTGPVAVLVVPADEESVIARQTIAVLTG